MKANDIILIISIVLPLIENFVHMAEASQKSGAEKHDVVADQTKAAFEAIKASGKVRELKNIEWEEISDLVVPLETGLIDLVVRGLNNLGIFKKKNPSQ